MGLDERDLLRQPAKLYLEGSLFLLVCLVEKCFWKKKKDELILLKRFIFLFLGKYIHIS